MSSIFEGAEALCGRDGSEPGYALSGSGAGANLMPANEGPPQSPRTIKAREIDFPMVSPYGPVTAQRVPGFSGLSGPRSARAGWRGRNRFSHRKPFGGFRYVGLGAFEPGWDAHLGLPPPLPGTVGSTPSSGSGGFDWSQIFSTITQVLPATISAVRGQGVPPGYYPINQGSTQSPSIQPQYSPIPPGYEYRNGELIAIGSASRAGAQAGEGVANIANSIGTFVSQNSGVVLIGGAMLLFLFMRPPGRR